MTAVSAISQNVKPSLITPVSEHALKIAGNFLPGMKNIFKNFQEYDALVFMAKEAKKYPGVVYRRRLGNIGPSWFPIIALKHLEVQSPSRVTEGAILDTAKGLLIEPIASLKTRLFGNNPGLPFTDWFGKFFNLPAISKKEMLQDQAYWTKMNDSFVKREILQAFEGINKGKNCAKGFLKELTSSTAHK
jgi:hypothetical protein